MTECYMTRKSTNNLVATAKKCFSLNEFLGCILNIDIMLENNVHRNINGHLSFKKCEFLERFLFLSSLLKVI